MMAKKKRNVRTGAFKTFKCIPLRAIKTLFWVYDAFNGDFFKGGGNIYIPVALHQ